MKHITFSLVEMSTYEAVCYYMDGFNRNAGGAGRESKFCLDYCG
ncbi:hypothetical protein [Prosthecobacter fusiformis]|nr:hypothetical protein [Prosthecobacter fusiformis]